MKKRKSAKALTVFTLFWFGYTYPSRRPIIRIDYVFSTSELAASGCSTFDTGKSDHRAAYAVLETVQK